MRRWLLFILAGAPLVLAACSNFSFNNPIGVPTLELGVEGGGVTLDPNTGKYILTFSINAYTLQGSPGGSINKFRLQGGKTLSAGIRVDACPVTASSPCGPFTTSYSFVFDLPPPEGTYTVVAYDVVGDNGAFMTITLPLPLQVY